jgi:ribosomal protein S18 acetylase RimI-like enzyme
MLTDPAIPGLALRRIDAPRDYARMNEIANDSRTAQGIDYFTTVEQLQQHYEHLEHCDITTDLWLAELDGRLAGYVRADWHDEQHVRAYEPIVIVDPAAGLDVLYPTLFEVAIRRVLEIAATHPSRPKVIREEVGEASAVIEDTIRSRGFQPVRVFLTMVRPTLDDLEDAPLPPGLEIRAVRPEDMDTIYQAEVEAFRDHWGQAEPSEHDRNEFFNDPVQSDTSLWRVAWDGDRVAGSVRSYINAAENERLGRTRGWVESISVGREWRRRGLARALIAASFPLLRARGMTEGVLGVDAENDSGAVRVYERCGFVAAKRLTVFELSMHR